MPMSMNIPYEQNASAILYATRLLSGPLSSITGSYFDRSFSPNQCETSRNEQQIAGRSDNQRSANSESDTGCNCNNGRENARDTVDSPEPWCGSPIDCGNQTHSCRKAKSHQQPCWRNCRHAKCRSPINIGVS